LRVFIRFFDDFWPANPKKIFKINQISQADLRRVECCKLLKLIKKLILMVSSPCEIFLSWDVQKKFNYGRAQQKEKQGKIKNKLS
jgi:hypothetical protein